MVGWELLLDVGVETGALGGCGHVGLCDGVCLLACWMLGDWEL